MLTITLQGDELWDEDAEVFRYTEGLTLEFEHSLVSLSKWEAKYHKLFLTKDEKTEEEMVGYIKAMLLTPGVTDEDLNRLTEKEVLEINDYINDPMTGSTVNELHQQASRTSERLSSELIYFWMSQYQIPVQCENWHLNRLFTLIKIHYAKSQKPKKVPRHEQARSMAELNAARKAKLGTSG